MREKQKAVIKILAICLLIAIAFSILSLPMGLTREKVPQLPEMQKLPIQTESNNAAVKDTADRTQPEQIQPSTEPEETEPEETGTEAAEPEETDPGLQAPGEERPTEGNGTPEEGPEDDTALRVVTDLQNGDIAYNQLQNDILPFYAYLINGQSMTLKVKLRNSSTPQNGQYLTGDGKNYTALLCRGETNYFTLYIKDGNETVQEVNYAIDYVAQKATEDTPTVGDNPPAIVTNLEGVTELSNRNFTLTVEATAYTGQTIYASSIQVCMDGREIIHPTGGPKYEYQLYFPNPYEGDSTQHLITVRAWDDEGNSRYVAYRITYRFVDTGDRIGTAYIVLDATTVGLGILEEPYAYTVKQNEPASYAVMAMLEEYGYDFRYNGSPDSGFYLQRISRGGMMDYASIPDNLWQKVQQDGLTLTGQYDPDSLGEFDYTQGSGWMYSVGGVAYSGKGLSGYFLSDGDTVYIRFTLAYGKDIGGYSATGDSYGLLPSYCGKWVNDTYIAQHRWGDPEQTQVASCTQNGEISCTCAVCHEKNIIEQQPMLPHTYEETERQEPENGNDGWVVSQCIHCGIQKQEILPWSTPTED